ncbi:MAG: hypothetical protein V4666_08050 [Bacteroidota bacterium]
MRTIRTKVYNFNELVVDAQQNAIENNSNINVEHDWWIFTYEDANMIGLKLTGFNLEYNIIADGKFINDAHDCATKIIKHHGEDCESYSFAVGYLSAYDNIQSGEEDNQDLEEIDDEFLHNILCYYAEYLQKECDYLQTEEAIRETLISNEYEFLKDGSNYTL